MKYYASMHPDNFYSYASMHPDDFYSHASMHPKKHKQKIGMHGCINLEGKKCLLITAPPGAVLNFCRNGLGGGAVIGQGAVLKFPGNNSTWRLGSKKFRRASRAIFFLSSVYMYLRFDFL